MRLADWDERSELAAAESSECGESSTKEGAGKPRLALRPTGFGLFSSRVLAVFGGVEMVGRHGLIVGRVKVAFTRCQISDRTKVIFFNSFEKK